MIVQVNGTGPNGRDQRLFLNANNPRAAIHIAKVLHGFQGVPTAAEQRK